MGQRKKHIPVKLVVGFIFKDTGLIQKVKKILTNRFGEIDFESEQFNFTYTDYYEKELGRGLKKSFISFRKLIVPETLVDIKIFTNKVENKFSLNKKRRINIDPGYVDLSKLVLATTKDYRHRIYLNRGIYEEVTLYYQNKTFNPCAWTYPDYKTKSYIEIFNRVRAIYNQQINI